MRATNPWLSDLLLSIIVVLFCFRNDDVAVKAVDSLKYGVDISFPMHHATVSTNYPWLPHNNNNNGSNDQSNSTTTMIPDEYKDMPIQPLGNKQALHDVYMKGCVDYYGGDVGGGSSCTEYDRDRVAMNLRQPSGMRNYTAVGYTKIKAPPKVYALILEFWKANRHLQYTETWSQGKTTTNHWASPTYFLSVENASLPGGGHLLKQRIWNAARDTLQAWTGHAQAECSLYGIRVYKEGAQLASHVDRLPLVSSAIINVDQDVDEPWPLEVIGRDGLAHNVTMEPGDMVLYESHSIIHGRPFPLRGRFYANVFIHFEPTGPLEGPTEFNGEFPPYIVPGTLDDELWRSQHPDGHRLLHDPVTKIRPGSTELHEWAHLGDLGMVKDALRREPKLVRARDNNQWLAIHEAIRTGAEDVVEVLLQADELVDVNDERVMIPRNKQSLVELALDFHPPEHPVVILLRDWNQQQQQQNKGQTMDTPSNDEL